MRRRRRIPQRGYTGATHDGVLMGAFDGGCGAETLDGVRLRRVAFLADTIAMGVSIRSIDGKAMRFRG
jgi:hypothetical protein